MRAKRKEYGFTLIELLIVVAIIGILAAIAIPNLLSAIQRAKQKRTMADMKTLASVWEARSVDTGRFNAAGAIPGIDKPVVITDLTNALKPMYIRNMPEEDGWGSSFFCYTDEDFGGPLPAGDYVVASSGRDKILESTPVLGGTAHFDCDIIFSNGRFIAYPDGIQIQ